MLKHFTLLIACTLFSCSTSLKSLQKNDTLLIQLNDSKEKVVQFIGKPSLQNDTLFRYNTQGLLIYFRENTVREIICTQLFEFTPFQGRYYGVQIGETQPKVIQTLGNNYTSKQENVDIKTLIWKKGKVIIEVDFWENSEVNQRVHNELIDTSKRIRVIKN